MWIITYVICLEIRYNCNIVAHNFNFKLSLRYGFVSIFNFLVSDMAMFQFLTS